jgi:hypothetical protein
VEDVHQEGEAGQKGAVELRLSNQIYRPTGWRGRTPCSVHAKRFFGRSSVPSVLPYDGAAVTGPNEGRNCLDAGRWGDVVCLLDGISRSVAGGLMSPDRVVREDDGRAVTEGRVLTE